MLKWGFFKDGLEIQKNEKRSRLVSGQDKITSTLIRKWYGLVNGL